MPLSCSYPYPYLPSYGLAGCDGGRAHRYLQWLEGGGLDTSRAWPYVDGATRCCLLPGLNLAGQV